MSLISFLSLLFLRSFSPRKLISGYLFCSLARSSDSWRKTTKLLDPKLERSTTRLFEYVFFLLSHFPPSFFALSCRIFLLGTYQHVLLTNFLFLSPLTGPRRLHQETRPPSPSNTQTSTPLRPISLLQLLLLLLPSPISQTHPLNHSQTLLLHHPYSTSRTRRRRFHSSRLAEPHPFRSAASGSVGRGGRA